MKAKFRSVDFWKSALMDLPENSFFELLRAVFGNIKTPFNKQRLMEELFTLLSREEIRNTIAAYINDIDHRIIAAVALLNDPVQDELEAFFSGEFSSAELHGLIINLEERLILYRFREKGFLRLSLNPVLEKILAPYMVDPSILFPSFPSDSILSRDRLYNLDNGLNGDARDFYADEVSPSVCISDVRLVAALFAFILSEEDMFKAETIGSAFPGLRKKILDDGKKVFPDLDLELALNTLLKLGLFQIDGQRLVLDRRKTSDFCSLSREAREDYWTAAVYLCLEEDVFSDNQKYPERFGSLFTRSSRSRLRFIAGFYRRLKNSINPDCIYPETTLRRLVELLDKDDEKTAWGSPLLEEPVKLQFEPVLEAMEKTCFLEKVNLNEKPGAARQDLRKNFYKTCLVFYSPKDEAEREEPVIVMDTASSFVLYPEISFADALALTNFCTVKDTASSLLITRESAVRGFDQNINAAAMLNLLDRLSGNRINSSLGWTLNEWEGRYAEVSLSQGVVLTLSEDRRYLAEAGPIASLVRRSLAPGVYLLSSGERSEAAQALRKAGVDIIAQPPAYTVDRRAVSRASSGKQAANQWTASSFPSLDVSDPLLSVQGSTEGGIPLVSPDEAEAIKEKLRKALDKMQLTKPERDELTARIERRLILTEAQLEKSSVRYERLEARGLDFAGKTSIARQAVDNSSLLEIFWPGSGGETNSITGVAQALEKKGNESILVLKEQEGTGNTIRIPLGKISLIRRIKQSIFKE